MAFVGYGNDNGTLRKIAMGTLTASSSNNMKVTCGFKPKRICYYGAWSTTLQVMGEYDEDISTTTMLAGYRTSSSAYGFNTYTIGASNSNILDSVDNDGFTIRPVLSAYNGQTISYFAIG